MVSAPCVNGIVRPASVAVFLVVAVLVPLSARAQAPEGRPQIKDLLASTFGEMSWEAVDKFYWRRESEAKFEASTLKTMQTRDAKNEPIQWTYLANFWKPDQPGDPGVFWREWDDPGAGALTFSFQLKQRESETSRLVTDGDAWGLFDVHVTSTQASAPAPVINTRVDATLVYDRTWFDSPAVRFKRGKETRYHYLAFPGAKLKLAKWDDVFYRFECKSLRGSYLNLLLCKVEPNWARCPIAPYTPFDYVVLSDGKAARTDVRVTEIGEAP
jgi:hypothetical protein